MLFKKIGRGAGRLGFGPVSVHGQRRLGPGVWPGSGVCGSGAG